MHDHRELGTGPPIIRFATFVSGSTNEIIQAPEIDEITEDMDRPGYRVYKTFDI